MGMPVVMALEDLMPRFYFDLTSKDVHITDDCGKYLENLNGAYDHARNSSIRYCFMSAMMMRIHGRLSSQTTNMMLR
jgi:hypothetical protein